MISNTIVNYLIAGMLGLILQVFGVKIPTLKTRSKAANHPFVLKDYFSDDWPTLLASVASIVILIFCLDEVLTIKPGVAKYVKWLFVFVGFTGSSLVQAALSVTSKKINQIIDLKTNIADGVQPPVTPDNKDAIKEIIKDEENKTT